MTYIEWLEDKCLHILDESWVCDLMSEHADEWEYCQKHCENGKGECLRRLYTADGNSSEKPNNCTDCECTDDCTECKEAEHGCKTEPKTCENRECKNYDTINDHCRFIEQCHYEPKTEPQGYCNECKWYGDKQVCGRCRSRNLYAPKDEPQTDCAWGKSDDC